MANINLFYLVADVSDKIIAPKGMWESLISGIYSFASNYGLTILLLTLFIKIAMTPLDFWQKYTQKITTLNQEKMKPELTAINKRYAYDRNLLNQKTMEVYKKHGVSPMGSCLSLIVNLVIVLAVFITLINGINKMSNYRMQEQYAILADVYIDAEANGLDPQEEVLKAWNNNKEVREKFLWIKNIWRKDSSQSVIPKYEEVDAKNWDSKKKAPKLDKDGNAQGFYALVSSDDYYAVMDVIIDKTKGDWNGYYILTVLAVVATYFSSRLLTKKTKGAAAPMPDGIPNPAAQTGKITAFVLPVIMGIFTLTASSTFALYLVVSQLLSVVSTLALSPIIDKIIEKKKSKTDDSKPRVNYSR